VDGIVYTFPFFCIDLYKYYFVNLRHILQKKGKKIGLEEGGKG
jgi:hypothetical protein